MSDLQFYCSCSNHEYNKHFLDLVQVSGLQMVPSMHLADVVVLMYDDYTNSPASPGIDLLWDELLQRVIACDVAVLLVGSSLEPCVDCSEIHRDMGGGAEVTVDPEHPLTAGVSRFCSGMNYFWTYAFPFTQSDDERFAGFTESNWAPLITYSDENILVCTCLWALADGTSLGSPSGGEGGDCARRGRRALRPTEGTPAAQLARFSGLWRKRKESLTKLGWDEPRTTVRPPCSASHPGHRAGAHATRGGAHDTRRNHGSARNAHVRQVQRWSIWAPRTRQRGEAGGGRPGQHAEGCSTRASRTRKHGEACGGQPECGGEWAAKTIKRSPHQPVQPPVHQLLGPANTEMTPQGARAAAADRTQRPDAACEGKNGCLFRAP